METDKQEIYEGKNMVKSISPIFPSTDIGMTGKYYEEKLGFKQVKYLNVSEPHICLYLDDIEIILTQANTKILSNHEMYGYGYDAYIYTDDQEKLRTACEENGVKIVHRLGVTDYHNRELVIEDIDGRWIAFGLKERNF